MIDEHPMVEQSFGGAWTETKLAHVRKYLDAYTTALKNQRFKRIYVDAFAGTGYRNPRSQADQPEFELEGFEELAKGSARIALEIEPPFDKFVFIEKNHRKFDQLCELEMEFPGHAAKFEFIN